MCEDVYVKELIPMDTSICQYMRLDHFISLMESKEYFVHHRRAFNDSFEMQLPLANMFPIHEAGKDVAPEILENKLKIMFGKLRENYENGKLLASCWCLQSHENFLMWHYYASKIGVCVKSTVHRFLTALDLADYIVCSGKMVYKGYNFDNNDLLFTKDRGYECESEYRFYFMPKDDSNKNDGNNKNELKPIRIKADTSILIDKVIVSPYIDIRTSNEICVMLRNNYNICISPSKLRLNG